MHFTIKFYTEQDGTKPVSIFIKSLNVKLQAKVVSDLRRLEMLGNEAREPLSKHLSDGIYECRSKLGSDIVRILYFFDKGRIIIATNGFVKKRRKTPKDEIELAKQRRTIYFKRKEQSK